MTDAAESEARKPRAGTGAAEHPRFDELAGELATVFARPLDERTFETWALRAFRWQFDHDAAFRGYCAGRGATPATVARWQDVPPVPTAAFKRLRFLAVEQGRGPEAVFRTSGTTGGTERRGEHAVASLALYRAALLPAFRAHLLPDGARPPVLALVPSPEEAPRSSLSRMIGVVIEELGGEGSAWLARADGAIDARPLLEALRAAAASDLPVLVAATAFGLVHALDALVVEGARIRLPEGSRLMETGGFKGRARVVARSELYAAVRDRLGIPAARIVNEYGMTELLSQFYEPVLADPRVADLPLEERFHVAPHWVRSRVLDPVSLAPVADGDPGLLCHYDLANLGSVSAVLTEDVGIAVPGGFRLIGRTPGAEPRGCSLATEELLLAATAQ